MLSMSSFRFFLILLLLNTHVSIGQIQVNSISSTASTCPNNGTITVSATSPSPPVLYSIVSGPVTQQTQTNSVFNSLPPGNYTVKITDGIGNEALEAITIGGNYTNPSFSAVPTSPYCVGENNGELVLNVVNNTGLAPYSWELLPSSPVTGTQSTNVFENLPAGNYSVRVTDACGSVSTNTITITPPNITTLGSNSGYFAKKIGCDTMSIYYSIAVTNPRFPLSFSYTTTNGTYIPTAGTTTINSASAYTHGIIYIEQIIPNMTYGDVVSVTVTNACGSQFTIPILNTYPFNFYPSYSFSECGNSVNASYTNSPTSLHHTYLNEPVTYTYTDLGTNTVVASSTINNPYTVGVTIPSEVNIVPGQTYRLTITDDCGQSFTQDYLIPTQPVPMVSGITMSTGCIDSVAAHRVSVQGFSSGLKLIVLSGPQTLGSTKSEYEYSDTYTWPSDTFVLNSSNSFELRDLSPGTYQYLLFDDCGQEIIRSFTITPQQVVSLKKDARVEKGCPGENKIIFSTVKGEVTIKDLSDGSIKKIRNFPSSGQDSVVNLSSGQYEITYQHHVVPYLPSVYLNDHPISCWKIVDTLTIPPYENPEISVSNGIMCNEQIHIELIPDTTKGVAPFQYEIHSGPETFPLQSSNLFTVSTPGTYYARIFDACGNATVKQVTIDTLSFDPIELDTDCTSKKIVLPSSVYYTYEWSLPNGQTYTGDSLVINLVTPADTGIYEISRITNINGCVDTITTEYHIGLPNHFEQTISFCSGTTVIVGNSTYHLPGIYYDTLTNPIGCDSVVVTTLTLSPQQSDTTIVFLCNGDSIPISGNYYSIPGFYLDSVQNGSGCYDLLVTELRSQQSFYNLSATICNGQTYSIGSHVYSSSGIYTDTLQSVMGCDSIVILDLEVLPEMTNTIYRTICENEEFYFSGNLLTSSGMYSDTLVSSSSCDSIVTLHLTVTSIITDTLTASICEGESFLFGGNQLETGGTYFDTIQTNTCDSIIVLNLIVLPNKYHHIYDTICEGEDYVFGGLHYLNSGSYSIAFPTSSCDSIVTLHLTVNPPPLVSVTSSPEIVEPGEVVILNASSDTDPLTYVWESNGQLSDTASQNPTVTVNTNTWIKLTVTDNYGCTSTVDYMIGLYDYSTLYVPNGVTPDGDQHNHVFRVYGTNITELHIIVFDRWGEIIFESFDFNFIWDLTYKGNIIQDGVYVYKLYARGTDNAVYDKVGHITVIR